MKQYDFKQMEKRWQRKWAEARAFAAQDFATDRKKAYVLVMFPYPSGDIHMGHLRNYAIGDVVARYRRMQGYNVLNPMGFDAFGLPAEQAAIDRGVHPREWTNQAVSTYRRQLIAAGISYDWDRMVNTSEPAYYRWTQWLFLKLYELGLVYKKDSPVNWCPEHGVLANEEAADGTCWRCGRPVVRRQLSQWFVRTTAFAEDLLAGLDELPGWPERIRLMQRNWIGRSEGTGVIFEIPALTESIEVFTTRADTLFGVTFVSIAPEHPLAERLADIGGTREDLAEFREKVMRQTSIDRSAEEREKEGLDLGVTALHPLTGREIPILAADYVLMEYGTGVVMGVPAHDTRDFAFAKKYGLDIVRVIEPLDAEDDILPYTGYGVMVNSGDLDGKSSSEGIALLNQRLAGAQLGGPKVQYKLRDWLVSRQRYWGVPIPLVHCEKCGWQPVPEEDLPVLLPEEVTFSAGDTARLANNPKFVSAICPRCGGPANRETDTLSTFMDSAWYYLRFCDPHNDRAPFDGSKIEYWMPVDNYIGGKEHTVGHMLYSRFVCHSLHRAGIIKFKEPFRNFFSQGILYKDGAKMSKSRGNVVSVDHFLEHYGADTARMISLFWGPPDRDVEWQEGGVEGCARFIKRAYGFFAEVWQQVSDAPQPPDQVKSQTAREILRIRHLAVKDITASMDEWHFNTTVSSLMIFLNQLTEVWQEAPAEVQQDNENRALMKEALLALVKLLSPMAPHLAEELWALADQEGFVMHAAWPTYDERHLKQKEIEYGITVNGKLRGRITLPATVTENRARDAALADERIRKQLKGRKVMRVIVVPGRVINIVAK
ncbi:MAG: leucine--tRNA ligase [Planctomycetales bacterium 4484_113]|nr:MAG: leucine--tRNA ligase [Planctomycetales bacterium 4484_113]